MRSNEKASVFLHVNLTTKSFSYTFLISYQPWGLTVF